MRELTAGGTASRPEGMTRSRRLGLVCSLMVATMILTAASNQHASTRGESSTTSAAEATFSVTGTAPSGVHVAYGIGVLKYQGARRLPLHVIMKIAKNALFADVSAELQGSGNITCTIRIGKASSTAHATGGFSICSAQLNRDVSGGWG
jgi:hypothetical protein